MLPAEPGPEEVQRLIAAAGAGTWSRAVDPRFGAAIGAAPGVVVTLLPDGETLMQTKRALRGALSPAARQVEALEARLDAVRVYVMAARDGEPVKVVITRRDLHL